MADSLRRDEVRRLTAQGAQSVEVLPAAEYDNEHLPGDLQHPAEDALATTVMGLNRTRPVIAHCWDGL